MSNKKNILVTGGAGNIGSALVEALITSGNYFVVIMDNLLTGSLNKLPVDHKENWEFVKGDVNEYRDIAEVMLARRFDFVFHYAAVVGVQRTQDQPISVLNDIQGIKNILDLSKNTSVKRVFYSSSSEVYGEPVHIPQNEHDTPLNSRVPYAVVKNVGESFLKSYHKEYGLDFTIFRFFNTYGPSQTQDFVISRFLSAALKNEPLTIYGNGNQSRTFCYIDDNVEAVIKCFEKDLFVNEILNVGSEKVVTILELANIIIELAGSESKITFLPPLPEGDMKRRQPDNSKMKKMLNRELLDLKEGIQKMLAHKEIILYHE
jgi:nucleoside-diphosphate-sugar epimerase